MEEAILVNGNENDLKVLENLCQKSDDKIFAFKNLIDENSKAFFRSYFASEYCNIYLYFTHGIYESGGLSSQGIISLIVSGNSFYVYSYHNYLVFESQNNILFNEFSEAAYNTMVAIGFVTGKFIQDEVQTFQYRDVLKNDIIGSEHRKLRGSSNSIYEAINTNPFAYKHFIGNKKSEEYCLKNTFKPINKKGFSLLTQLIHSNSQIQYALVLFNEANDRRQSLLIRNNSNYIVLEVLRKFFFDVNKDKISKDYYQQGNSLKAQRVFETIVKLNERDLETIHKRNQYLHGEIKYLEGQDMIETMEKQLALIYKIVLKYLGCDVHVIDHYAIRNNDVDGAYIKLI